MSVPVNTFDTPSAAGFDSPEMLCRPPGYGVALGELPQMQPKTHTAIGPLKNMIK